MLLAFPWNPVLQLQLGPNLKFESIRPAALFIAFVNPATDCVFHLNGCCRELFGCFKGLNLSVASHQRSSKLDVQVYGAKAGWPLPGTKMTG